MVYIKSLYDGMNNRSTKRGNKKIIKRLLTYDDLIECIKKHGNKCAITGAPLAWGSKLYNSGSFDRIDSDGDYTPQNIQPVLLHVNYLKGDDLSNDQCLAIMEALRDHAV
jgi:hypothetical protein